MNFKGSFNTGVLPYCKRNVRVLLRIYHCYSSPHFFHFSSNRPSKATYESSFDSSLANKQLIKILKIKFTKYKRFLVLHQQRKPLIIIQSIIYLNFCFSFFTSPNDMCLQKAGNISMTVFPRNSYRNSKKLHHCCLIEFLIHL